MKRAIFLVLIAVFVLTGCVEYGITIKVNKDGSGQIVEKMLLSKQMMNMAQAISPGGEAAKAFTKEEQMKKAPRFGGNVVFFNYEEIQTEAKEGYKVVYKFTDINKVKLSEEMFSEAVESLTDDIKIGKDDDAKDKKKDNEIENFFNFEYKKNGKLVILNGFSEAINKAKKADKELSDDVEDDEEMTEQEVQQQLAMAKMFVQGMKFYTKMEFEGIKAANVPYENNQITLFEIDMDKLLKDPVKFSELMKDGESEMLKFFNNEKKIDGITFHNLEKITVDLK